MLKSEGKVSKCRTRSRKTSRKSSASNPRQKCLKKGRRSNRSPDNTRADVAEAAIDMKRMQTNRKKVNQMKTVSQIVLGLVMMMCIQTIAEAKMLSGQVVSVDLKSNKIIVSTLDSLTGKSENLSVVSGKKTLFKGLENLKDLSAGDALVVTVSNEKSDESYEAESYEAESIERINVVEPVKP